MISIDKKLNSVFYLFLFFIIVYILKNFFFFLFLNFINLFKHTKKIVVKLPIREFSPDVKTLNAERRLITNI